MCLVSFLFLNDRQTRYSAVKRQTSLLKYTRFYNYFVPPFSYNQLHARSQICFHMIEPSPVHLNFNIFVEWQ